MFLGILLGIAILGAMVFMALDKKSTFHTRLVSIIAIAVMILTVIIALVVILTDTRVEIDPSTFIVGAPVEVDEDGGNLLALIFSIIFLLALFVVIMVLAMREHKRNQAK